MKSPAFAPTYIPPRWVTGPAAAVMLTAALAACGSSDESSNAGATAAAPTAASGESAAPVAAFEITHDWQGHLPPNKTFDASDPQILSEDQCLNGNTAGKAPWKDEDGRRAPAAQSNPLAIYADGRCNSPLSDPNVGFYMEPTQASGGIRIPSGTAIGVECYVVTTGGPPNETIQDVRGPSSRSPVWVGGVILHDGGMVAGFIPEVNAGYVDESKLPKC